MGKLGRFWVLVTKLFLLLKCLQCIGYLLKSRPTVDEVKVAEGLGPVFDVQSNTFHIMNERNISFTLQPPTPCPPSLPLLLTISSGPLNRVNRDRWREAVSGRPGLRLLFLVSQAPTPGDQGMLETEQAEEGDIIQTSLQDGHRKLGYKILTGFVWTFLHCKTARFVAKSDDNVVLDLDRLTRILGTWGEGEQDFVTCSTPKRNMKTLRNSRTEGGGPHMTGNWSLSKEDLETDIMPDFCTGFISLTSPKVGAALVQVGLALYPDKEVVQSEDSLITGVLRERLPWVSMVMLEKGTWRAEVWRMVFSHCPFMTITKQTFFNDLVVAKHSSRSHVQYVGPVTSSKVWRYYLCMVFEVGIEKMRDFLPKDLVPSFLWNMCSR